MLENQTAISILSIMALIVVLYMTINNEMIPENKRKQLSYAIITTITVIGSECITNILEINEPSYWHIIIFVNVVGFSLSPIIPVQLALAIRSEYKPVANLQYIVGILNAIVVFLTPITGWIFKYSVETGYERGNQFWIYVVSYGFGILILFSAIFKSSIASYDRQRFLMPAIFTFVIAGTSVQVIVPDVHITWICVAFSIVIYYAFICESNNRLDSLTNLYNRRMFDVATKRFSRGGEGTIIVFDVDEFKDVNDTFGHLYGDYCLSKIGELIRNSFLEIGIGYRMGGDEFCVICQSANEFQTRKLLDEFIKNISYIRKKDEFFPTVSYGIGHFGKDNMDFEEALVNADCNMYFYKAEESNVE